MSANVLYQLHHPDNCPFRILGSCGCDGAYDNGCYSCSPKEHPEGYCAYCDITVQKKLGKTDLDAIVGGIVRRAVREQGFFEKGRGAEDREIDSAALYITREILSNFAEIISVSNIKTLMEMKLLEEHAKELGIRMNKAFDNAREVLQIEIDT